jgi:hypothetical protein
MVTKKLKVKVGQYGKRMVNGKLRDGDFWMQIIEQTHFGKQFGNQLGCLSHMYAKQAFPFLKIMSVDGKVPKLELPKSGSSCSDRGILYVASSPSEVPSNKFTIAGSRKDDFIQFVREYNADNKGDLEIVEECIFEGTSRIFQKKADKTPLVEQPVTPTVETPTVNCVIDVEPPKQVARKLVLSYIPAVNSHTGTTQWWGQITEQSHRGTEFTKEGLPCFYDDDNGIVILSKEGCPSFDESTSKKTPGYWRLFAQGTKGIMDGAFVSIPNEDLLIRLQNAVALYNKLQGAVIEETHIDPVKVIDRLKARTEKFKSANVESEPVVKYQPELPLQEPVKPIVSSSPNVPVLTIHAPYHLLVGDEEIIKMAESIAGITPVRNTHEVYPISNAEKTVLCIRPKTIK